MCGILGLLPFTCYVSGGSLFTRFGLTAEKHQQIVAALAERDEHRKLPETF